MLAHDEERRYYFSGISGRKRSREHTYVSWGRDLGSSEFMTEGVYILCIALIFSFLRESKILENFRKYETGEQINIDKGLLAVCRLNRASNTASNVTSWPHLTTFSVTLWVLGTEMNEVRVCLPRHRYLQRELGQIKEGQST